MKQPPHKPVRPIRTTTSDHQWKLGGWPKTGFDKISMPWSAAFRATMMTKRKSPASSSQRVMVRVRYSSGLRRGVPATLGLWRAHGRYIQRDSAAVACFDDSGHDANAAKVLHQWQKAKDPLMWKAIVSPEHGKALDLQAFARELMAQVEKDLGQIKIDPSGPLEWVAAVHTNTDHPHIHFAIRGIDKNGKMVRLPRKYIKQGLRAQAQSLATQKLGLRVVPHTLNHSILDVLKLFKAAARGARVSQSP